MNSLDRAIEILDEIDVLSENLIDLEDEEEQDRRMIKIQELVVEMEKLTINEDEDGTE